MSDDAPVPASDAATDVMRQLYSGATAHLTHTPSGTTVTYTIRDDALHARYDGPCHESNENGIFEKIDSDDWTCTITEE